MKLVRDWEDGEYRGQLEIDIEVKLDKYGGSSEYRAWLDADEVLKPDKKRGRCEYGLHTVMQSDKDRGHC